MKMCGLIYSDRVINSRRCLAKDGKQNAALQARFRNPWGKQKVNEIGYRDDAAPRVNTSWTSFL